MSDSVDPSEERKVRGPWRGVLVRGGLTVAVTGRGRALIVNSGITEMEIW